MMLFNTFSMLIMITMVSMVAAKKEIKGTKIKGATGVDIVLVVGQAFPPLQDVNGMPLVVATFKKFFTGNFDIGPNMKLGIVQLEKKESGTFKDQIVLPLTVNSKDINDVTYTTNIFKPDDPNNRFDADVYSQSLTNALVAINQMFDAKESTRARVVVFSPIRDYITSGEENATSLAQQLCSKKNAHIYAMAVDPGRSQAHGHAWDKTKLALCPTSTGKGAKPKTENLFLTTEDDAGYEKTLDQIKEKMVHDLCNFKELCVFAKPGDKCKYELLQESANSIEECKEFKPTPKTCTIDKCRETCDNHWPWDWVRPNVHVVIKSLPNCDNITASMCDDLGNHGVFQRVGDKPESADIKVKDFLLKGCVATFQCLTCKKAKEEAERKKEEEKRKEQAEKQAKEQAEKDQFNLMMGLVGGLCSVVVVILIVVVVVGARMVKKRRMEVAETNAKMEQLMNTITQMSIMTSQMGGPKSIKPMDGKKSMKPMDPVKKSVKPMGGGSVAPKKKK